jgi:hypothetical protein
MAGTGLNHPGRDVTCSASVCFVHAGTGTPLRGGGYLWNPEAKLEKMFHISRNSDLKTPMFFANIRFQAQFDRRALK